MLRMLIDRLAFSILALLFVGLLLFVLTRGVPGSPARVALGLDATDTQTAQFEKDHGLDRPVAEQYIRWLGQLVLHGDFGRSFVTGRSMNALLTETLPITLELVLFAFAFAVAVALPIGVLSAVYEGTWLDHAARIFAVIGVSVPGFWLGLMLIRFPAVEFGWFPPWRLRSAVGRARGASAVHRPARLRAWRLLYRHPEPDDAFRPRRDARQRIRPHGSAPSAPPRAGARV